LNTQRNRPMLVPLAAVVAAAQGACTAPDGLLGSVHGADSSGLPTDTGGSGPVGPGPAECALTSPLVTLPTSDTEGGFTTCTGRIATAHFLNALCTCGDAALGDALVTRGFDSSRGAFDPDRVDDGGAAVGVNGNYSSAAGSTDIGGSLSIAGTDDIQFVGSLQVRGDLRAAGDVTAAGYSTVARNAWLAGSFLGIGPFMVSGELHHAATVSAVPLVAGSQYEEDVAIAPPCACEPSEILDVGALVDQASQDNDNATWNIQSSALESITGDTRLALPCGRFYLTRIAGGGDVVLEISAPTAVFIDESIDLDGGLFVELDPGTEFDVFVRGSVQIAGTVELGTEQRPAAGRMYVGGDGEIALAQTWVGNLYAPRSRVTSAEPIEIWGSIFADEFLVSDSANFVFDRSIYSMGNSCEAAQLPTGACTPCGYCVSGLACVDGTCGPCRTDDDCCSQAICANGSCAPLVEIR